MITYEKMLWSLTKFSQLILQENLNLNPRPKYQSIIIMRKLYENWWNDHLRENALIFKQILSTIPSPFKKISQLQSLKTLPVAFFSFSNILADLVAYIDLV